jgi:hypothetical protein
MIGGNARIAAQVKRYKWRLSEEKYLALCADAFGKERKRPIHITQATLAALLLDFNHLCTLTNAGSGTDAT